MKKIIFGLVGVIAMATPALASSTSVATGANGDAASNFVAYYHHHRGYHHHGYRHHGYRHHHHRHYRHHRHGLLHRLFR